MSFVFCDVTRNVCPLFVVISLYSVFCKRVICNSVSKSINTCRIPIKMTFRHSILPFKRKKKVNLQEERLIEAKGDKGKRNKEEEKVERGKEVKTRR